MRRFRRPALGAAVLALGLVLSACRPGGGGTTQTEEDKGTVVVGVSGAFAENQIVAEMYAQVLEEAGYEVQRQLSIETRETSQPSLEEGEIDLKPEYLLSLLLFYDSDAGALTDPQEVVEELEPVLEEKDISVLEPSQANDTNALVVTKETAEEFELTTIADLEPVAGQLVFGGPAECPERPLCQIGLTEKHQIEFERFEPIGACDAPTATALKEGAIDVALLCSTQSVIASEGHVVLEDEEGAVSGADHITPVIRTSVLNDEIEELLNEVSAALTTEKILDLNSKVEIDREDADAVAKQFLTDEGIL
ncbi:MAG: ABC transporter substrate-binding protein [Actinomycetota bacterium]